MASSELQELGEEEDEFTKSTSKLQALVKGMTGFDILEQDGQTFKDIYDIMVGIGEKWNELNDVSRASLGEALAGKILLPDRIVIYVTNISNCRKALRALHHNNGETTL